MDNLDFDGSGDYVETVNADCSTSNAFTFATWVKRDRYGTAHVDRLMISVNDGGWGIGFGDMSNDDRLFLTKVGVGAVYSTGEIDDLDWHFVTVTQRWQRAKPRVGYGHLHQRRLNSFPVESDK